MSAAAAVAATLPACQQPVDCAVEPGRCRGVHTRASRVPLASAGRGPRAEPGSPSGDPGASAPPRGSPAPRGQERTADRLRRLRLGTELEAEERRVGDLVGRERSTATPELLIRRIRNVGANHNLPGLKRFVTPELAKKLDSLVAEQPQRFWRHIERYVVAGEHGFKLLSRRGSPEVGLQIEIEARGDIHLRPLLIRTAEGYRFQRF